MPFNIASSNPEWAEVSGNRKEQKERSQQKPLLSEALHFRRCGRQKYQPISR